MPESEWEIPNDPDVDPEDIKPGADLPQADLSEAFLVRADLSEANLQGADLSGANLADSDLFEAGLNGANISESNLRDSDLSEADLSSANLSRADLRFSDLSGSNLSHADLPGANLSAADLSDTNLTDSNLRESLLWDTLLSGSAVSRQTVFTPPEQHLDDPGKEDSAQSHIEPVVHWDKVARANHEIRSVYSDNGLISQARDARVRERRARRKEARHDGTRRGTFAAVGSLISRWTTGYGVKLLPVIGVLLALFFGSAAVYWETGMSIAESLYYSAVTFTTSPPSDPSPGLMRLVAGVETFLGTTMIVFLGYVLGAREQV